MPEHEIFWLTFTAHIEKDDLEMKRPAIKYLGALLIIFCTLPHPASQAAVTWDVDTISGKLLGASNVPVLGNLYNVSFKDGVCSLYYPNCNTFTFQDLASATAASNALLNDVFTDHTPPDLFDSNPALTNGCTDPLFCLAMTPYGVQTASTVLVVAAKNGNGTIGDSIITTFNGNPLTYGIAGSTGSSGGSRETWAVWTPVAAVPVPPALTLFLSGLLLLALKAQMHGQDKNINADLRTSA